MVFGTFDLLHEGHVHFFTQAKKHADRLVVSLATDNIILLLKGKLPVNSFAGRLENLYKLKLVDEIVAGDTELNSWKVIRSHNPDVVALGYDQEKLAVELKRFINGFQKPVKLVYIGPHTDRGLHSSVIRSKMLK